MNVVNQPIVKHKLGLLNLAQELGNVSQSQACKIMGVSRDTFYRYREAKSTGGVEALLQKDRRRPNLKNRVDDAVENAVLAYAIELFWSTVTGHTYLNTLTSTANALLVGR